MNAAFFAILAATSAYLLLKSTQPTGATHSVSSNPQFAVSVIQAFALAILQKRYPFFKNYAIYAVMIKLANTLYVLFDATRLDVPGV